MNEEKFKEILDKYSRGIASQQEIELVEKYFDEFKKFEVDTIKMNKYKNQIEKNILRSINKRKNIKTYLVLVKAAAILLFIIIPSFLIIKMTSIPKISETIVLKSNIGERRIIELPDGSKVKLNAMSHLSFKKDFGKKHRNLHLDGEAFFEVKKHNNLPFTVNNGDQVVQVIGTAFNVNNYNNSFSVTLVEGKVKVKNTSSKIQHYLSPGERIEYDTVQSSYNISRVDTYKYISWVDNLLYFENERLQVVIEKLELWYGKKIILANKGLKNCEVTLIVDTKSLDEVLSNLSYTENISYKLENNDYIITGIGCETLIK